VVVLVTVHVYLVGRARQYSSQVRDHECQSSCHLELLKWLWVPRWCDHRRIPRTSVLRSTTQVTSEEHVSHSLFSQQKRESVFSRYHNEVTNKALEHQESQGSAGTINTSTQRPRIEPATFACYSRVPPW